MMIMMVTRTILKVINITAFKLFLMFLFLLTLIGAKKNISLFKQVEICFTDPLHEILYFIIILFMMS